MKKVLIIQKTLPFYRKKFFDLLRQELKRNNVQLSLVYGKAASLDALNKDDVDLEWATAISNKLIKIGNIEFLWQPCLKQVRTSDIVIVEQANKLLLNYVLMFLRKKSPLKLCFWGHGRNLQDDALSLRNKFKLLFLKKCDRWFPYTEGVKFFLIKHRYAADRINVVQNALDTLKLRQYYLDVSYGEIEKIKSELTINSNNVAIFCGSMYPEKRIDFILAACYKIKRKISDFHMIFIGSGVEKSKITEASCANNWIHYVGAKKGRDRITYFKLACVQLLPAAVGLSILDSFALETPLITTDVKTHGPEIEYLKNGQNGIITKSDLDIYSETVVNTLRHKKFLSLIPGCIESANQYTIEAMVKNFTEGILSSLEK